ncbi:hypothetical protein ACP70R_043595 [Stipagrostis hirtigluma subsp. patula]
MSRRRGSNDGTNVPIIEVARTGGPVTVVGRSGDDDDSGAAQRGHDDDRGEHWRNATEDERSIVEALLKLSGQTP